MKKLLAPFFIVLALQGCGPWHAASRPQALPQSPALQVPELAASADTLPARVNAAQMSGSQTPVTQVVGNRPTLPAANPHAAVRQLRAVRKQMKNPRDSTQLYERRRPVDLRVTNRMGLASLWLAVGSFVGFLAGGADDSGIVGLAAVLAAIAAFVTGLVSLAEFRRNPDKFKGKGYPIVGISWGSLVILLFLLLLVVVVIVLATI